MLAIPTPKHRIKSIFCCIFIFYILLNIYFTPGVISSRYHILSPDIKIFPDTDIHHLCFLIPLGATSRVLWFLKNYYHLNVFRKSRSSINSEKFILPISLRISMRLEYAKIIYLIFSNGHTRYNDLFK